MIEEFLSKSWWLGVAGIAAILAIVIPFLVIPIFKKVDFLFLRKKIKNFLSEPWWIGIAGIAAILAIVIPFLVIPIFKKVNFSFPEKLNFSELRIEADSVFNLGKFDQAYQLYEKIKHIDNAGYDKFYNTAKSLYEVDNNCDDNTKMLLEYAKKLDNTSEVNELLNKCE